MTAMINFEKIILAIAFTVLFVVLCAAYVSPPRTSTRVEVLKHPQPVAPGNYRYNGPYRLYGQSRIGYGNSANASLTSAFYPPGACDRRA